MNDFLITKPVSRGEELENNVVLIKEKLLKHVLNNLDNLSKLSKFMEIAEQRLFDIDNIEEISDAELSRRYRLVSKNVSDFIENTRKILSKDVTGLNKDADELKEILLSLSPSTIKKFKFMLKTQSGNTLSISGDK